MTSQRQCLSNKRNASKSSGPRSRVGKARSSNNALRHGFASETLASASPLAEIARLTNRLVHLDDSITQQAARAFAEAECTAGRVRQYKAALLDHLEAAA